MSATSEAAPMSESSEDLTLKFLNELDINDSIIEEADQQGSFKFRSDIEDSGTGYTKGLLVERYLVAIGLTKVYYLRGSRKVRSE